MKIKNKLKWQMITAIIGVSFVAVTLAVLTMYNTSKKVVRQQYIRMAEDNLRTLNIMLEKNMSGLITSLRSYILDDEQLALITADPESPSSKYYSSYDNTTFTVNAQPMFAQEATIDGIYFFDNYNRYYMYKKNGTNISVYLQYYSKDINEESRWFQAAEETRGKEIFWNGDVLNENNEDCFSIIKKVNDSKQAYQQVALVVLTVRKSFLEKYYKGMTLRNTILFVDADDNYVFSLGKGNHAEEYYEAYLNQKRNGDDGGYLFLEQKNNITGWNIVTGVRRDELYEEDAYIRNYVITLLVIATLGVVIMSALITTGIYKPLKDLEAAVEEINSGNPIIETRFDNTEIGIIGQTLKKTLDDKIYLEKKIVETELSQRKAELLLLQGQINPHYLYNTLDSIYVLALKYGTEDIGQMVLTLSELFKLSLKGGRGYATVREEVGYVEKYMSIIGYRFRNRVQVRFDVEEEIMEAYVLSFILQPFVENAVLHGLEPKLEGGCVYVAGALDGENLVFRIYDDGVGFHPEEESVQEGYGIRNVKERIALIYGGDYGVEIGSEIGKGTTVTVCIPYKEMEFYENNIDA